MRTILLRLKKFIPRPSVLRSLVFVFGFGYIGFAYASLFPGPLTGHQVDSDPIGGYVSHAQFERGCTHCHVPLHCIGEDRCQECHVDVAQEKAEMSGMHGLLPGTNRCQNCHVEHQGREADITTLAFKRIDHAALAKFSLDYHQEGYDGQAMNCQSCHSQDDYREASLDCVTCHAEHDHDLMATHIDEHGMQCLSCHDGTTRLAEFEHNVQAFNLTGAHIEVDCKECHVDPELQYGEAPKDCVNCHEQPLMQTQFGIDCQRCHTTEAWAPAQLTQHTFDLYHALPEEGEIECQACHKLTYAAVDCKGCHADQGRLEAEHSVLGIVDSSSCASCHPTGMPGETLLARNFPGKVGTPPGNTASQGAIAGGEGPGPVNASDQPLGTTQPSIAPTFSAKDVGQVPRKEQEGQP